MDSENVALEKADTAHVEEYGTAGQLGHLGNQEDHDHGVLESLRRYPQACFWCIYAVWCVVLVSFENQASGNVLGIPEFRKDFGSYYDGNYVLAAKWQSAFSGAPIAS